MKRILKNIGHFIGINACLACSILILVILYYFFFYENQLTIFETNTYIVVIEGIIALIAVIYNIYLFIKQTKKTFKGD